MNKFSLVQSLSHVQLFVTPWTAAQQASLSFTNSWGLLKLMSIESVILSNHLILCCPLLLLPSLFPYTTLFRSPWTAAHQASLSFTISQSLLKLMFIESMMPSMGFSRQEYWSRLSTPSRGSSQPRH